MQFYSEAKINNKPVPTVEELLTVCRRLDYSSVGEDMHLKWQWFCEDFLPCVSHKWQRTMSGLFSDNRCVTVTDETWAIMALDAYGEKWDVEVVRETNARTDIQKRGGDTFKIKKKMKYRETNNSGDSKRYRSSGHEFNQKYVNIHNAVLKNRKSQNSQSGSRPSRIICWQKRGE